MGENDDGGGIGRQIYPMEKRQHEYSSLTHSTLGLTYYVASQNSLWESFLLYLAWVLKPSILNRIQELRSQQKFREPSRVDTGISSLAEFRLSLGSFLAFLLTSGLVLVVGKIFVLLVVHFKIQYVPLKSAKTTKIGGNQFLDSFYAVILSRLILYVPDDIQRPHYL
jgi:hypothetical protein